MGRRRKNRTHLKGEAHDPDNDGNPKSFVVKHGQVGSSLTQLVRDIRKVLEPNTASRLKERSRNKLKDYLVHAPVLHVTHILAFTLTSVAPSLRIVRLSAGPTLSFRIERYSLIKDILSSKKRARSIGLEYLSPPLLVLASFPPPGPTAPPHLTLLVKTFQSIFPSLSPQNLKLSSARRVVLISYNVERGTINFRHYLITIKPYGVSKKIRRVLEGKKTSTKSSDPLVKLGKEHDVADYILRRKGEPGPDDDGYETATSSASSAAEDEADAISLADDYVGRNNKKGQKKAVRLDEIGPRMELRLVKIVEGVPGKEGAVMYHGLVKKTKAEIAALKVSHAEKLKLKQQRREEQERNVRKKKDMLAGKKPGAGKEKSEGEDEDDEEEENENADENESGNEEDWEDDNEDEEDWNEDEDVSEGEESGSEDENGDSSSEGDPPPKKNRTKR